MSTQNQNRKHRENRPTDSFGGPNQNNRVSLIVALLVLGFFLYVQFTDGNLGGLLSPATTEPPTASTPPPTRAVDEAAAVDISKDQDATAESTKEPAEEAALEAATETVAAIPTREPAPEATIESQAQATKVQEARATLAPTPTANAPPTDTPTSIPPTATPTRVPPTNTPQARASNLPTIAYNELPPEAHDTIALIDQGGPFPYSRDGITFQNRERLLPRKSEGYYREYTVITPGASTRGAKRIVAGEAGEMYYTDDHYESFSEIIR